MTTVFHAWPYGRFIEIQSNLRERNFVEQVKAPIFLEAVLAIEIIGIGTCGLHTVSRAFQNAENSTDWNIKKVFSAMHKLFYESPSKRGDYEKVSLTTKEDYPLLFCATRWVENQLVTKKAQSIWPTIVAVVDFWSTFPKSKQPGRGDPKGNKRYQVLLSKCKDQLITVKFQFLKKLLQK